MQGVMAHTPLLILDAGKPFDVMVDKPFVDCSIDAMSGEVHITQVLQVCYSPTNTEMMLLTI